MNYETLRGATKNVSIKSQLSHALNVTCYIQNMSEWLHEKILGVVFLISPSTPGPFTSVPLSNADGKLSKLNTKREKNLI